MASARATQVMAPSMALAQINLDTEGSPVFHIHQLALGLAVDAELFAAAVEQFEDAGDGGRGVEADVERSPEDVLGFFVEELGDVGRAGDAEGVAEDDVDAGGDEVAADGDGLFAHPFRGDADGRDA